VSPVQTSTQQHEFDPNIVQQLGRLDWIAHIIVQGLKQGQHRSWIKGFSTEFSEFKPYIPGDDLRFLDWRVYARTHKTYVRCYKAETNLECYLLLDASRSMAWSWKGSVSKLEYAINLYAALAYFMTRRQDMVGLLANDATQSLFIPPSSRREQLERMLALLDTIRPGSANTLPVLFRELSAIKRHRGQIIVCSDFEEDTEAIAAALPELTANGDEVMMIHLLDTAEVQLPYADSTTHLLDSETGARLRIDIRQLREEHRTQVDRFRSFWHDQCLDWGIRYLALDTGTNYVEALLKIITAQVQ